MTIKKETIIYPTPDDKLIREKEEEWELTLPNDYKKFIQNFNGAEPNEKSFRCNNHEYAITRFLCILENIEESENGWYDISVVESQIGERLTANEDLIGIEVLPIAEVFAGDYVCLDFRENQKKPCVCLWSHEESNEFDPVTYKIAESFSNFLNILG